MFGELFRLLRTLFRSGKFEREMERELRFHLERETEANLRRGMSEEEARLAALRSFGGFERVKEECRDASRMRWLEMLWQDVRHAVRVSLKKPGFTAVAVLMLALGIGANTALFSVVNTVLLRPLPYEEADRLVALWETIQAEGGRKWRVAPANFLDWKGQNQVFEEMAAFSAAGFILTGSGEPEQILGGRVSLGYFAALGVRPMLGREFLPEEHEPGKGQVIILGHSLWQSRFGSDPAIVGRSVTLDGASYPVVGVMPPGVYPTWPMTTGTITLELDRQQFFAPMSFNALWAANRRTHVLGVIARLKRDVTMEQAQAEMGTIARRLEQEYPANKGEGILLNPFMNEAVGDVRPALLILFGAVAVVLLIACANVASLLLSQFAARSKEIAIRAALGAGRARLIRQFFVEGLLLSLMGGAAGIWLASSGIDLILKVIPQQIPRLNQVRVDLSVLGFTLLVSLLTSVIFGLAPAWQSSNPDLQKMLKDGGRTSATGSGRQLFRRSLVVAQVSLAVVLAIAAALLVNSFWRLRQVDPGFNPERVVTLDLAIPPSKYGEWHKVMNFQTQLIERINQLPGVQSAALAYEDPLRVSWLDSFIIEGRPQPEPGQSPIESFRPVSPEYFRTLGIELVSGRQFTDQDDTAHPGVVIINEGLARRYFSGEAPLGKRLRISTPSRMWGDAVPVSFEIVGVVRDVKSRGLRAEGDPAFYIPARQFPSNEMTVLARTQGDPQTILPALRQVVWSLDADQPIAKVSTMEKILADDIAQPRFNTFLMGLFGIIALMLAAVGIYGLLSYSVAQRTHEIGVRLALGAGRRDVLKLVVGQGMFLASIGIGIGVAAAFAVTRLMASLLFGVSPTDPLTFAGIALLLSVVVLAACYIPARRATRVDPMIALRYE